MAARRTYSDADRALVYAELEMSDGNIRRTARNLGMPISTVRYYRDAWRKGGLPEAVSSAIPAAVGEFVEHAERIRDKLLVVLETKVDRGELNGREIVTALGVLTDKIRAAKGLDTRKVEHTLSLPNAQEMRELFAGVIGEVVGAAEGRNEELHSMEAASADIIDGVWEPALPKALPASQSTETPEA